MAAPVNANINIIANTEQAMGQFRALQAQVAATNKSISATSGAAAAQQAALSKGLLDSANASRMWQARIVPMNTAVQQFSTALDKGRLSLGQYTRYAASQLPGMSRVFKREFDMMNRAATRNVRQMQTQYLELGRSATGAAQAMALTPTALNKHASAAAIAAQRQMMFNRMIDLGTTKLLNYGKNTQWAGRQLMVGFSIPLAMVGAVAAKTFKEIDKGSIAFKRVYGDLSTTTAEMERNLQAVKDLGAEYTRYGLKLSDTIELAADVAATGAKNNDLLAATEQTLRLSTLGLMEYDEALEATISLQTAFGVSSEDLGSTIDFLNVVENETILTMQDMAAAIPRVAPVIKGLGGDVRDLAVLMTAMREGGVTAAEGANALKTGLGRLINPTKAARDVMDGFGISLEAMIQSNRGDLMGMINDFGAALATLDDFEQQQALEKVFGKRQYARLGALFKNIANDASQAQRTVELTNMSLEDLGSISERELGKIEEATSTKFAKAVEQLKVAIAPIGEQFMKALTPVINFITKLADSFNNLPDNIKNAISIGVAAIAGIGPIVLMTVGLIANGIANIGKLIQTMRKFFARLRGDASLFNYLTQEEREATTAANALSGATDQLTGKFLGQKRALDSLITTVGRYSAALASSVGAAPMAFGVGAPAAAARGMRSTVTGPQSQTRISGYADGVIKVPGTGNKDTVPAMLTPGESVVTKQATQSYAPIIAAMNAGTLKMMATAGGATGTELPAARSMSLLGGSSYALNPGAIMAPGNQSGFGMSTSFLTRGQGLINSITGALVGTAMIVEKEGGSIEKSARMTSAYFNEMQAEVRPAAEGIAQDIRDTWREMSKAEKESSTIDDVIRRARTKINARLTTLSETGVRGAAAAQGASRLLFNPASRADLLRYGDIRTAAIRRTPEGRMIPTSYRPSDYGSIQRGPSVSSPIASATRMAFGGAMPSNYQYSHLVTGRQSGPQIPMQGGALGASSQIRSQMQTALSAHTARSPLFAVPPQATAAIAQAGTQMGSALGINLVMAAEKTTKDLVKRVLAASGHSSPAALMPKTGAQDGTAYGNSWNQSVKKAIMTGSGKIVPPGGPVKPPAPATGGGKPESYAAKNAAALKTAIMNPAAKSMQDIGRNTVGPIKAASKEMTQSFKNAFSAIRMGMTDAVKPFITPMKTMAHRAASTIIDGFNNASIRVKSAYETAALKTMMALDSVKNLPNSINKAATVAKGRLMNMFQTMVPENLGRRMMNKMFYGAQDIAGKGRQVGGLLGNRVPRAIAMDAIRQKSLEKFNAAIATTSGKLQAFSGKVTRAGQIIMNPVPRAIALDAMRQRGIEKLNAAIAPAANAMTRLAAGASTAAQILMNPVPRAIAMEVVKQRITQAGRFVADTIRVNIQGAMQIGKAAIQQGFNNAKLFITNSAQTVKTAITSVGTTIKTSAGQLATGIKLALPQIKQAATSMANIVKESGKALGTAIMDAASRARAAASGFFTGGVDAQGRTRGQRMAGMGNTGMMGLMGLSMAASFAGGEVGEMAQKIMPVTMGLMGLQMILPMLTNPLGLAVIGITALVGSFIYLRKQLDDAAKAAADVGANMNGVANGMKVIEDATGFKPPDIKDRLFRFTDEDREAMGEFGSYFESESGSKFIQDLKEATSEERYQKVSILISQGIASGLEEDKAKAFGFAIAEATGDTLLKSNIARDFANQIFAGGSQKLLEMEQERLFNLPELPDVSGYMEFSTQQRTMAERNVDVPWWQQALDLRMPGSEDRWQARPSIGDFKIPSPTAGFIPQMFKEIQRTTDLFDEVRFLGNKLFDIPEIPDIPGVTTTWTEAAAESEMVTEKAAKGLGYYLQTVQNLSNAEAVLEEERRSGLITFTEYENRLKELNELQGQASDYVGEIFSVGADAGSMLQALGDQLSFAGFSEDQIKRITDRFNPDALAQEIFGAETFKDLDTKEQKDYIEILLTEILSGLSPENIDQRLQDVEGTYKDVANKVVESMMDGSFSGLDAFYNTENMGKFIKENMGAAFYGQYSPEDLAENIAEADTDLKKLGTDSLEVFTRLAEFTDKNLAKSIMADPDKILQFGDAVAKLAEYEDIKIEVVMEKGIDPDSIIYAINQIKDIEFDTDIFGNAGYDADLLVQKMIDLGYEANKIPGIIKTGVAEATSEIGTLSDNAFNKLNNIKIRPNTMLKLFDTEYASSEGFMSALESTFPDQLPPSVLPILLQILNPEQIQALASLSEEAAAALMDNPDLQSYSPTGGMYGLGEAISDPAREAAKALQLAKKFMGSPVTKKGDDDDDGGGGGGGGAAKEQSALEKLQESIEKRTALYLGLTKVGKKLDSAKKGYFGRLLAETTTNNSIANQLRKMNLSETLIADILAEGAENAEEIIDALGPNGLKRLSKTDVLSRAGELISEKRGEAKRGEYKATAKRKLEETGKFTAEEIEEILQDEGATEIIALLPKKARKVWNQLIKALRGAADATEEVETASERALRNFDEQSSRFDKLVDMMNQGFDAAEMEAADAVAAKFFEDNTGLAEKLAESTGHTVENGYQLAEAMERQVSLNDRLIDQEQEVIDGKQEEIDDYNRINDLIKQGIDDLKRQEELRNRRSESLSRDLDEISRLEDQVRESYEKRIDALDKVAEVNDYIIEQQKKQIDLSRAISEGDIYAATQAAQDMRAASAQQAVEQRRSALEQGMENAISGLTNAEGMTRADIEEEINNIKEQNYQTSLLIRKEEDRIYQNNLEVRRLSNEIYDIQENIIEPLQNQNEEYSKMLEYYKEDADYQVSRVTLAGMTREQFDKQAEALKLSIDNAKDLDPELKKLVGDYNAIEAAARAAADQAARLGTDIATEEYTTANPNAATTSGYAPIDYANMDPGLFADIPFFGGDFSAIFSYAGGLIKKYAAGGIASPLKYTSSEAPPAQRRGMGGKIKYAMGGVAGNGSRDSVHAMLTPGEFVVRKAMVDKYGIPMMKALNQGSFAMPRYDTGQEFEPNVAAVNNTSVSNISAPVYNTYDMKFAISGANQSADQIANQVMFKMRQLQNQGVRSNRGY